MGGGVGTRALGDERLRGELAGEAERGERPGRTSLHAFSSGRPAARPRAAYTRAPTASAIAPAMKFFFSAAERNTQADDERRDRDDADRREGGSSAAVAGILRRSTGTATARPDVRREPRDRREHGELLRDAERAGLDAVEDDVDRDQRERDPDCVRIATYGVR